MTVIYFIGETAEQGIRVKKEAAEEMVKTSNGKLAMQEVE